MPPGLERGALLCPQVLMFHPQKKERRTPCMVRGMSRTCTSATARWLRGLARVSAVVWVLITAGCSLEVTPDPPRPSVPEFERVVYPLLLRDCGFPDCHGNPARFFRVYGPGRTRLAPTLAIDEPATDEELRASYDRARSMLTAAERPQDSLLLRKPLEIDLGGAPHLGVDAFGQDIYRSTSDPGYDTLLRWASTGE